MTRGTRPEVSCSPLPGDIELTERQAEEQQAVDECPNKEDLEAALEELEQELMQKRPLSHQEQLERSLQEAIDSEEFERAAVLRDELKNIQIAEE